MQYLGGKSRLVNKIVPILENHRKKNQLYVEPFVGAANIISKMSGNRIGYDTHPQLIAMYDAIKNGWIPPTNCSEDEYNDIKNSFKNNDKKYPEYLYGFIGFSCAFGGNYFDIYAKNNKDNYCLRSHKSLLRKMKTLHQTPLLCNDYKNLNCENALIYCDPPYKNTKGYTVGNFNHNEFVEKIRYLAKTNTVFISEYEKPADDFKCIAEFVVQVSISQTISSFKTEKLFVHESTILQPNIKPRIKFQF